MASHNQYPANPEESLMHQEVVQFNDGEMAIGSQTAGDMVDFGPASTHKYARDFHGGDMAMIRTESGNTYSVAGGLVIDSRSRLAYDLPEDTFRVTVGEPCLIPGTVSTTNVRSVWLRYKTAAPGSSMANRHIDRPSPFRALEAQVSAVHNARHSS